MKTKILSTTCPMDCPDTCSLEIQLRNDVIESIRPGKNNPDTNGFICTKLARYARRVYSKERIHTPLIKNRKKFTPVSWPEAIDKISGRFQEILNTWGGEAILPFNYGGSNGFFTDDFIDNYFFTRLGASRLAKTLCAVPTSLVSEGMYGKMPGVAFKDFIHARLIVLWGANPSNSNIHLLPYIKSARKNGAKIVVIDPVRNYSNQMTDIHLAVKPGTDLPLALALINYWHTNRLLNSDFIQKHVHTEHELLNNAKNWPIGKASDVCGVPEADIINFARMYADISPALIRCGWGVERNRNGAQAIAAILAMPALMGKFGIQGGGYTLSNSGFLKLKKDNLLPTSGQNTRSLNMSRLGQILGDNSLNPPLKAIFIYNCNPVATVPNQNLVIRGLQRPDLFKVVFDQVMTDSALFADIILPATTFLEHHDIRRSYGSYYTGQNQPVIQPIGESRTNFDVFSHLGRKMFPSDPIFNTDHDTWLKNISDNFLYYNENHTEPGAKYTPVQFGTIFPATPGNRVNLFPAVLGDQPYKYVANTNKKYPLSLISPATSRTINSTMGEYNMSEQEAVMHPVDATDRRITRGAIVRIFNAQGEVISRVNISDKIRQGVIMLPKGAWRRSSINGSTATALCPDHLNRVGAAACYNDALVEVELANEDQIIGNSI